MKIGVYKFIIILGLFVITSCNKSNINFIEIHYLPSFFSTPTPVNCDMISSKENEFFSISDISKKKIINTDFLSNFEKHYEELYNSEVNDSTQMDARIKLLVVYKNSKIDTLCFGEYFGIYKNNVKQIDNKKLLELIKNEVEYNF